MDLGISGRSAAVAAASTGLGFATARVLIEELLVDGGGYPGLI